MYFLLRGNIRPVLLFYHITINDENVDVMYFEYI